jgi:hypothetical protein
VLVPRMKYDVAERRTVRRPAHWAPADVPRNEAHVRLNKVISILSCTPLLPHDAGIYATAEWPPHCEFCGESTLEFRAFSVAHRPTIASLRGSFAPICFFGVVYR